MRTIVAIPVLAAIWFGTPAPAAAQDQAEGVRVITKPVIAESARREVAERSAVPSVKEAKVKDMVSEGPAFGKPSAGKPAAAMDDQRRSGRGAGGGRGSSGGGTRGPSPQGDGRPPVVSRNPGPGRSGTVNIYARPYFARPFYYSPSYYDRWARGVYGWSPLAYAPWGWIYGTAGYASLGYAYGPYGAYGGYEPYAYRYGPFGRTTTFDTGGVRLKVRPRDAQVFVDGYYAGVVDDFDGAFQSLRLEQGGHKIEIRMPGYETMNFDVHVQPDRTITMREDLRAKP